MATITSYSELVTAVTEYLAREEDTTTINRIPTFIQLCEAKLNRRLFVRQMEKRAIAVVNMSADEPEYLSLPSDFQSMRRIRITTVSGKPFLNYLTPAQMDEFKNANSDISGTPRHFTIFGSDIELGPNPDTNYTIEMVYRSVIDPLSESTPTNWLLDMAPDAYLYGTLLEAAPHAVNDSRLQIWGAGLASTIDDLNTLGQMSTYNAGPLQVRLTGFAP